MILNRLGNKTKIAQEIQKYFPKHDIYIEPFFGAGGMFFNKPKARHNFVNDFDDDVYNLFRQLLDNKEEFTRWIELTPITETQFKEWGKGKREDTPMLNAVRFLFISNFGLYGKANTLRIGAVNPKKMILSQIEQTFEYLSGVYFFNTDFRDVYRKCDYRANIEKNFKLRCCMRRPKGKSLTPDHVIKRMIWETYGGIIPMTEKEFMQTPVTPSDRMTYYLNRSKYINHKEV